MRGRGPEWSTTSQVLPYGKLFHFEFSIVDTIKEADHVAYTFYDTPVVDPKVDFHAISNFNAKPNWKNFLLWSI